MRLTVADGIAATNKRLQLWVVGGIHHGWISRKNMRAFVVVMVAEP
jgi:hypothetical protein